MNMESGPGLQLENFRQARRELEASVLPLATSVDGRRFSFQASLYDLQLQVGGYVMLEGDGPPRLGQVITLELDRLDTELTLPALAGGAEQTRTQVQLRYAGGEGTILEGDPAPFHDVLVRVATGPEMQAWLQRSARHDAQLRLGQLAQAAEVPCRADAGGFNRHTFLCGQSGSGKTYSLGVILEQLLIETDLRLVVLDPNSDFVRLGQVRGDADPVLAERFRKAASGVTVYSAGAPGERRLRLHAAEIDPATQAAALRLDPIEDREEYAALAGFLASGGQLRLETLAGSDDPEARRLSLRLRNLGIDRYAVWAGGETGSVLDAVHDQDVRCAVIDLGSLPTREEQSLVAAAVLGDLWRRRQDRKPVLIVIDEASHRIAPARQARRTFSRYFTDKRDVLFAGSEQLPGALADAVRHADDALPPFEALLAALVDIGDLLAGRVPHAAQRRAVIKASPELQERERTKFAAVTSALTDALQQRGAPASGARLLAQVGVAIFQAAFERWTDRPEHADFSASVRAVATELAASLGAADIAAVPGRAAGAGVAAG